MKSVTSHNNVCQHSRLRSSVSRKVFKVFKLGNTSIRISDIGPKVLKQFGHQECKTVSAITEKTLEGRRSCGSFIKGHRQNKLE